MLADSALTRERPDIWHRALLLCKRTTGMLYLPKLSAANGVVWACGGYLPPMSDEKVLEYKKKELKRIRDELERLEKTPPVDYEIRSTIVNNYKKIAETLEREVAELEKKAFVWVPEGAMEWLLHEVGHWLAATPQERCHHNYGLSASEQGHNGEREWQAWGFEEIILAPWGPSRQFAPPTQRDGAAFSKTGPMPEWATAYAAKRIAECNVDIWEWRALYGEWINWAKGNWNSEN